MFTFRFGQSFGIVFLSVFVSRNRNTFGKIEVLCIFDKNLDSEFFSFQKKEFKEERRLVVGIIHLEQRRKFWNHIPPTNADQMIAYEIGEF